MFYRSEKRPLSGAGSNVRDEGKVLGGHLVEEMVPEHACAVNDAVDPAMAAGHLAQGNTNRLGVGYIAG